jgi:hypothetical protein
MPTCGGGSAVHDDVGIGADRQPAAAVGGATTALVAEDRQVMSILDEDVDTWCSHASRDDVVVVLDDVVLLSPVALRRFYSELAPDEDESTCTQRHIPRRSPSPSVRLTQLWYCARALNRDGRAASPLRGRFMVILAGARKVHSTAK